MGIFQPAMLVYWRVTKYESLSLKQQPNKNSVSTNLHLQEAAFFATNFATSMTNHETLLGTMPYPCPPLLKMMIDFPFSPFLMGYICSFPKEIRRVATSKISSKNFAPVNQGSISWHCSLSRVAFISCIVPMSIGLASGLTFTTSSWNCFNLLPRFFALGIFLDPKICWSTTL